MTSPKGLSPHIPAGFDFLDPDVNLAGLPGITGPDNARKVIDAAKAIAFKADNPDEGRRLLGETLIMHAGCSAGDLRVTPFNGRLFSPARTPLAAIGPYGAMYGFSSPR